MKIIKSFVKILFLLSLFAISIKVWVNFNCSFRSDKMNPNQFFKNHWDVAINDEVFLDKILDQNYRFLNKGRQSFVFVSDDDKYVIKFFRFHRYRVSTFNKVISVFSIGRKYTNILQRELNELYQENMNSYKLAYENLKEETGVIYVHLNKTQNLKKKLQIKDKFKSKYFIDLDNFGFVIQKKTKSFMQALLEAKDDIIEVQSLLESFVNNLHSIYSQNILNKDRHVLQNLGVLDNRVLEIDIGRFIVKKELENLDILHKEAYHYTVYLKKWLSKNIPDAIPFLDSQIIKLLESKK